MHEAAVTKALISIAEKECSRRGLEGRLKLTVRLGALTTYKEKAIKGYFEALKQGRLKGAVLVVYLEKGVVRCRSCGKLSGVNDPYMMFCPSCDSPETEIVKGKDIVLESLTMVEGEVDV